MSQEWSGCLNDRVKFLSEHIKCREGENDKVLRTIAVKNNVLYIWNEVDKCVESIDTKGSEWCRLIPRPQLYFKVENISVNSTSSILCLSGAHGVATVKLPDRLSAESSVEVNVTSLCQRVFVGGRGILRKVEWYPASPTDSHLLLLTSDEKLRLCDVLDGNAVWDVCLGSHDSVRRNIPSKSSLGETPVDFDFGSARETSSGIVWPVYIVWGNGDVYVIHTNLEESDRKVSGPLKMLPSVQDNYGCDASSILVLQTNPPIVVTVTCNGLLNHFLLLSDEDDGVLYAVERIELELGLSLCEDREEDVVSCPVTLLPHPDHGDRYFCIHYAGIHTVQLPLVQLLTTFRDGESDVSRLLDSQSLVDYLLCTALNSDSNISYSPILGFACLDMTKLLVLLSNGKLITVLLPYQVDDLSFVVSDTDKVTENEVRNRFTIIVSNLLKENGVSSLPVIKLPGDRSNPKDWFDIVSRTTQSMRLVLKCHTEVALKVRQKSEELSSVLSHQSQQVRQLDSKRAELRGCAEQIAERYEEINDKQNELIKRTESLLIKIDCDRNRPLDSNHKKMMDILEKAKSQLIDLERDKNLVQSSYSNLEAVNKNHPLFDQEIDDSKATMLLKHVKLLTNELTDLTRKVKTVQQTASLLNFHDS